MQPPSSPLIPPSPFEVLGISPEDDEVDILDAYARKAAQTSDEMLIATELQWARNLALSLKDWERNLAGAAHRTVPTHPDALLPQALVDAVNNATTIDVDRFRKTGRQAIQKAIGGGIWHRSAWNDIAEHQHPEVCATLLAARAADLALADDPDQLFYELESEGLAKLCANSPLTQHTAACALAYLVWSDRRRAADLGPRLVPGIPSKEDGEAHLPSPLNLVLWAFERPDMLLVPPELNEKQANAVAAFFDLLRKAPLLSHDVGTNLIEQTARVVASNPGLFLSLFFFRSIKLAEDGTPLFPVYLFSPKKRLGLARYAALALDRIAVPLVPASSADQVDFADNAQHASLAFDAVLKSKENYSLVLRVALAAVMGIGVASLFVPDRWSLLAFGLEVTGLTALTLTLRSMFRRAARATTTALSAMHIRQPTSILAAETMELQAKNTEKIDTKWLARSVDDRDPLTYAMDLWDQIIGLVARWGPKDDEDDVPWHRHTKEESNPPA